MVEDEQANSNKDAVNFYKGSIYLFEGRYTQKMMTLYMQAEQHYCKKEDKAIIVFRFSPQLFEEAIWKSLKKVKLSNPICE